MKKLHGSLSIALRLGSGFSQTARQDIAAQDKNDLCRFPRFLPRALLLVRLATRTSQIALHCAPKVLHGRSIEPQNRCDLLPYKKPSSFHPVSIIDIIHY